MSSFSKTQLEKKLKILTMSQQSVQTLSLWCIHHRKHARPVVSILFKELQKVKPKKKMAVMYLINDILQNSKRKGSEYSKEFASILPNAFSHCAQECDEKMKDSLKRIINIWENRNVYDNVYVSRLKKCLDLTGFGEEASTTPPLPEKIQAEQFVPTEYKRPANPPDPDELVRKLQELENSATQDAVVRERIANLPTEVTDPTYIDKVEDLASARKLQDNINSACELLSEYNARLATEQVDRQVAQKMFIDYTGFQKYQLSLIEKRLQEYQTKLAKVTTVKKELKSHLENLPDLSKLPEPVPLPSAGDLFSSSLGKPKK